ncbi:hypothetical protein DID88_008881 [Monilinia fructigena]|uniref:Uncharacterized protein n=1 Tax=Monilinia fructigena TaxID=38457 RepID=A0A395J956_9HELO|nr:hypothetical protein DID88_008881 [Monilinia fructigena]
MTSKEKEKHGRSESGRRNTLQRMLDLENRNKLQRMQASTTSVGQPQHHLLPNVLPNQTIRSSHDCSNIIRCDTFTAEPRKAKPEPQASKNVVVAEPVKEMSPEANAADPEILMHLRYVVAARGMVVMGGREEWQRRSSGSAKKERERLKKEKEKAEKEPEPRHKTKWSIEQGTSINKHLS